jgi:hypothetical protein
LCQEKSGSLALKLTVDVDLFVVGVDVLIVVNVLPFQASEARSLPLRRIEQAAETRVRARKWGRGSRML